MTQPSRTRLACLVPIALVAAGAAHAAGSCDPLSHGAVPDGSIDASFTTHGTDNTAALQAAIDACAASGGGIVSLPPGAAGSVYVTGPIHLRSHILLRIERGVTLQGTSDESRYVAAFLDFPYAPNEALVSAADAADVGIVGDGTIDGAGQQWWAKAVAFKASGATVYPAPYQAIPTTNGLPRPWLVEFWRSRNVLVQGVHLQNSPMWNIGLRYVNGGIVTGVTVTADPSSPNTDGTDIAYSHDIALSNLLYDEGDDNVAIKSGLPGPYYTTDGGTLPPTPTTDVFIANSTFLHGHGLSIGSEAVNGVQHVRAANITFNGTENGFRIKSGRDRGNNISDIVLSNLKMTNVGAPLSLSAYYPKIPAAGTDTAQPITATTPFEHDITVHNLTATGTTGKSLIIGLPESPILNVTLDNVSISGKYGMELRNMTGTFSNVTVTPTSGSPFIVDENVHVAGGPSS